MAKKDENTSVIVPTADVKLGQYAARFTEEDLKDINDLVNFVKDSLQENINKFDNFIIQVGSEDNDKASECFNLLCTLHDFKWWFERVAQIDIKFI